MSETETERPAPRLATQATPSAVDVEAAKLWIITDRRLGKSTPEWVFRVAQGQPPLTPSATAG